MYYNENDPNEVYKAKAAAQRLRYKKSIAKGFNLYDIQDELCELCEECDNIRWCVDGNEDELVEALDGDEEEAFEFRMLFSELASEAERVYGLLSGDIRITEYFDTFFAAIAHGCVELIGFDDYEDDYFTMTDYEQERGKEEAEKRLMRLTKQELIKCARQCFGIATAILNVRYKADYLKAAMDVLQSKNHAYLEAVKSIEHLYEEADKADWYSYEKSVRRFDEAVDAMPARVWLE
ncbi:MAG: hypothetical protein NC401_06520 [Ruminococcus sp.]|nr:hypothetical protein [Ruminococcus sp.]